MGKGERMKKLTEEKLMKKKRGREVNIQRPSSEQLLF